VDLFIGLDVGTSAVKGILVSAEGRQLALARRQIRLLHPEAQWSELDPEEHVRDVFGLVAELAGQAPSGARIRGLSMAFASGNTLLLDSANRPLYNILSWLDGRSVGKTAELLPELDVEAFHAIVGWPYTELFPLAQIAWFRAYRSDLWRRVGRVCMNSDYLYYRLTGRWGMDHSTATTFYLQDQRVRRYHRPYLEMLGISEAQLSPLFDSGAVLGTLTAEAAQATSLPPDAAVVLGAFDHPCAARGTAVLDEGELLLSCGTSWVDFYPLADRSLAVEQKLLVDPFLAPDGPWGAMAALTAVGVTIDRYIQAAVLPKGEDPARRYEIFNAAAQSAPRGAGGLFLDLYQDPRAFLNEVELPSSAGSSRPSRAQVARALMEAAAFELKLRAEQLAAAGLRAGRITMVGGPTESPIWPQIVAEVSGLPLRLINGQTAGAVGAALLAAVGCGLFGDVRQAFAAMGGRARTIEPGQEGVRAYQALYHRYRSTFGK
jgi:sugar (pentulose or hexulose) kinase